MMMMADMDDDVDKVFKVSKADMDDGGGHWMMMIMMMMMQCSEVTQRYN